MARRKRCTPRKGEYWIVSISGRAPTVARYGEDIELGIPPFIDAIGYDDIYLDEGITRFISLIRMPEAWPLTRPDATRMGYDQWALGRVSSWLNLRTSSVRLATEWDVPEEFDAAKAASLLMRLHGKEAGEVARKRADTRMICGDADGMQAWALVIKALDDQVGSAGTKR
jgi:hypothetical protein